MAAVPAAAHPSTSPEPAHLSMPGVGTFWPVALVAVVLLLAAALIRYAWRPGRRAIATIAMLGLLGVAAQTGPHLVHHVLDLDQGSRCQLLQAAQHADAVTTPVIDITPPAAQAFVDERPAPSTPAPRERVPRDRAPPA